MIAKDKIVRSILDLEVSDPFFASVFAAMRRAEDNSISTMATDGTNLIYNADFVDSCSRDMLNVIISHEALHIIFKHPLLFKKLGNSPAVHSAGELSVNSLIYKRKGFPDDAKLPGRGQYSHLPLGKTTEWYFGQLKEEDKKNVSQTDRSNDKSAAGDRRKEDSEAAGNNEPKHEQTSGEGNKPDKSYEQNKLGSVIPCESPDDKELMKLDDALDNIIATAANIAKEAGNLSGDMEELIGDILGREPKINYKTLLRDFLVRIIRSGRSFKRPNRRSLYRQDIQPSRISKGLGTVVVGLDTSGSMELEDMRQAIQVCIGIGSTYSNFKLGVVQFDTEIKKVDWYDRFNATESCFENFTCKGRGGTSYIKFLDFIDANLVNVAIVVTDGMPNSDKDWKHLENIRTPVIWLITGNAKIPEYITRSSKVIRIGAENGK